MKALCVSTCQHDHIELYVAGQVYEISEEIFKSGYFKEVKSPEKTAKKEKTEKK